MDIKKLNEVLKDESFVKQLLQLETVNQVQQALADKGVNLTIEEIEAIKDIIQRYENDQLSEQEKQQLETINTLNTDELSDNDLQAVTGGFITVILTVAAITIGTVGTITGISYYLAYRRW